MSFDQNVSRLVRATLEYGRTRIGTDPQYNQPPRVQQVGYAFDLLYITRNSAQQGSQLELVAAENYLCARYWVASGVRNWSQMRTEIGGYFSVKAAALALGYAGLGVSWEHNPIERYMRANREIPTSRPDPRVLVWGLLGADHGDQDRVHSQLPPADYQFPDEATGYRDSHQSGN